MVPQNNNHKTRNIQYTSIVVNVDCDISCSREKDNVPSESLKHCEILFHFRSLHLIHSCSKGTTLLREAQLSQIPVTLFKISSFLCRFKPTYNM